MNVKIVQANSSHARFAERICELMFVSAKERGTGIARRTPEYIQSKMEEGKAVVAIDTDADRIVGFSYIETWSHAKFVANSGLIVDPEYRSLGFAKKIKRKIFDLSRKKYPHAKIFGITTGMAVMKINSELGYTPVTFSELTDDETFWKGCQGCKNYDILQRNDGKRCLCTGMLYDPEKHKKWSEKFLAYLGKCIPKTQKIRFRWWMNKRNQKSIQQEQQ